MGVDLNTLPIFPLPRALLFPNAVLPLHVFEPRYRRLLADCLASTKTMGIATLHDDDEPEDDFLLPGASPIGEPLVRRLIGVGTIVAHEPLPDGRSHIVLRGLGRARIDEEHAEDGERPYRLVRAVWVRDRPLAEARERDTRQTLVALADQLAERLPEGGDTLRALVGSQPDAAALSDLLSAALVTRPRDRLRAFETLDVARRADDVAAAIGVALAMLAGESGGESN